MTMQAAAASLGQIGVDRAAGVLAPWTVVAATSFNLLLAFFNALTGAVSSREVIAVEIVLLTLAHVIILLNYRPAVATWYSLMWFMTALSLARWSWLGQIDPKTLRDVIIIPTFLCLGIVAGRRHLNAMVISLQVFVLGVTFLEFYSVDLYTIAFNVKDYYINTRGLDETAFWNQESDLFVSATRPVYRVFLPWLDTHRLSSIFLEPVSLGNYCIIIAGFVCARFHALSWQATSFLIASNVLLLVASDGRLAFATSAAIIAGAWLAPRLPYASAFYLPGAAAIAFVTYGLAGVEVGADNFAGRIALTAELLRDMSLVEYMGVAAEWRPRLVDSGLAYLIATQSIVGVALIWLYLSVFLRESGPDQSRAKHSVLLYLALTMIVSYSFLTIKTAALAWYLLGALQSGNDAAPRREYGQPAGLARSP